MIKRFRYFDLNENKIELANKKVIIWGIGYSGLETLIDLRMKNAIILGYTDSYAVEPGKEFAGYPVYTFDEIKNMDNIYVYISTVKYKSLQSILYKTDELTKAVILAKGLVYGAGQYDIQTMRKVIENNKHEIETVNNHLCDQKSKDVFANLLEYRVSNNIKKIEEIYETSHKQYFPENEILTPEHDEVFVDAGAYDGNTCCDFVSWVGGDYKKIYAIEPDSVMQRVLYANTIQLKGMNNIEIIRKGAYSKATKLTFRNDFRTGSSCISNDGEETVETISIDEMLKGERATFIKMDIEGAEREAIEGCRNTITQYRPKLAISIYHKPDDLWVIPYTIIQDYPFYNLYMRHYTDTTNETVLYAIAKETK